MESLAVSSSSTAKLVFSAGHGHSTTSSPRLGGGGGGPHQLSFIRPSKHLNFTFSMSLSVLEHEKLKTVHPTISGSFSSSSHPPQTNALTEEEPPHMSDTTVSSSVHVKFHLQRQCSFGQQFLIVGDDPILGAWDPSVAIPLNWSDGHEWTVGLDVPVGRSIKFKFILKAGTEDVRWQPGPDRILQTWATANMITVYEDWENAELQIIIEEEPTTNEESNADSEILIVADNATPPRVSPVTDTNTETNTTNCIASPTVNPLLDNPTAVVADNISASNDKFPLDTNNMTSGSRSITLVSYEEVPVLVPGLLESLPSVHTEKGKSNSADISLETEKAEDLNAPELEMKDEHASGSPNSEITGVLANDKQELGDIDQVEKTQCAIKQGRLNTDVSNNAVFESDTQWGRRTLQKLLANLGFQ